jgi:hypothetical protein
METGFAPEEAPINRWSATRNWLRAGIEGLVPQFPTRRRRRIGDAVVALISERRTW